MLLNLNYNFKDLKNKDLDGNTSAQYLADLLSCKTPGISSIKAMGWALKLADTGEIDIDKADAQSLGKSIEDSDIPNLMKATFLNAIQNLKD